MNILPATTPSPLESAARNELIRGMRAAVPVMLGFIPFALVLGALAVRKGFAPAGVSLMTGLNFGGGSEFAALRLWTSPPHLVLIVAMSFLVNSRHILMGAALVPYLRHLSRRRALPALFFMCDESWAMALADARQRGDGRLSMPYYLGVSALLYLTWICFTTIGAVFAPGVGDLERYGFDMAFTAVFLVLLRGMWAGARAARPWLVSLVVAALSWRWLPGAWYVAAGASAGVLAALAWGEK